MNIYDDDNALWAAFQQRIPAAERIVFDSLFRPLCFYSEQITQHTAQTEDIVTESIIAAFNTRSQFVQKENLKHYLYRAVRNGSINYITQCKTRSGIHEKIRYLQGPDLFVVNEPDDTEVMRAEILQEIYQEIERLPDQCKRIFKMIFIDERSYEDIAGELNITVQTVRSQKSRALELLRTRLLKLKGADYILFTQLITLALFKQAQY